MNTAKYRYGRQTLILGVCLALLAVYALFDPAQTPFPRCVFHQLTGLDCPGCGSQRAVHSLLHGDVAAALGYNALLVAMLSYLAVCVWLEFLGGSRRFPRLRRALMGATACYILLAVFLLFFGLRNVFR